MHLFPSECVGGSVGGGVTVLMTEVYVTKIMPLVELRLPAFYFVLSGLQIAHIIH